MAKRKSPKSSAGNAQGFVLRLSAKPFAASSAVEYAGDDDTPRRRYSKDVIRVGQFRHPRDQWTLDVDGKRMDKWLSAFERMQENGVRVEVHEDHKKGAGAVRGYVRSAWKEGDTLFFDVEMIGDRGIKLAETVETVSLVIEDNFIDGEGNEYGEAIVACDICETPIITQQKPFKRIAASHGETKDLPILQLSEAPMDPSNQPPNPTPDPAKPDDKPKPTLLQAISVIVGEVESEEDAIAKLNAWAAAMKEKANRTPAPAPEGAPATLSLSLDADAQDQLVEGYEAKLDTLVENGRITPAVRKKLAASFGLNTDKPTTIALSRACAKKVGLSDPILKIVIDALSDNNPVELREKTKGQRKSLSLAGGAEDDGKWADEIIKDSQARKVAI